MLLSQGQGCGGVVLCRTQPLYRTLASVLCRSGWGLWPSSYLRWPCILVHLGQFHLYLFPSAIISSVAFHSWEPSSTDDKSYRYPTCGSYSLNQLDSVTILFTGSSFLKWMMSFLRPLSICVRVSLCVYPHRYTHTRSSTSSVSASLLQHCPSDREAAPSF